jgi:hypothetical protein
MSATNRGTHRNENDFYPTPIESFRPLIPYIKQVNAPVWEPACGDGRLIRLMQGHGITADGGDLHINSGVANYNFLLDHTSRACIVTNPPFSLALEFAEHALKKAQHVFLLLRLNFLASKKRASFWKANEPNALFVLVNRPSFTGNGTDACDYGWFYWGKTHIGFYHLE